MKNLLVISFLFSLNFCIAQPQWKFHVAFEDATGAKDTIWLIWDTTAHSTLPTDTSLGEGPANFNYNEFNVWFYNWNGDSTKTRAYPYNINSFLLEVRAFNYQYPLTIRWDSSLYHSPFIPLPVGYINRATMANEYFYFVNNDPPGDSFNMLLDNQAISPLFSWGSQSHFPMEIYVGKDVSIGINEIVNIDFIVHPNPFNEYIHVSTKLIIKEIQIITLQGQTINQLQINDKGKYDNYKIFARSISPGFYLLKLLTKQNQIYYKKIIKFK